MTYAEARRAIRKLLGPNAELELMTKAPVLKYQVGVRVQGVFTLAGAGNSWPEALHDVHVRALKAELKTRGAIPENVSPEGMSPPPAKTNT